MREENFNRNSLLKTLTLVTLIDESGLPELDVFLFLQVRKLTIKAMNTDQPSGVNIVTLSSGNNIV